MGDTGKSDLSVNPRIVMQPMSDGAMLMDTASGDCFELNRLGVEIWTALCDGRSTQEIADELMRKYSADSATVSSDVESLIEDLARNGILILSGQ